MTLYISLGIFLWKYLHIVAFSGIISKIIVDKYG